MALAAATYASNEGATQDDTSWHDQLRGVSYVQDAVAQGVRSPAFPMLRNQAGVGGVGTYWVTLVAGGLVEDDAAILTPRGVKLASVFLENAAMPDRTSLLQVLGGEDVEFCKSALVDWGRVTHLGAASKREKRFLADALLEPDAQRRMASAMQITDAVTSDGNAFQLLGNQLSEQQDPVASQLAAIIAVASSFENLHRELLFRFNQVLWTESRTPLPLTSIQLTKGDVPLVHLGDALDDVLKQHGSDISETVAAAVRGFSVAVEPAVRARNNTEHIRNLIHHHVRVQSGKLDASRHPKVPWVELSGNDVVITPNYALDEKPRDPANTEFTHPYRIEQFTKMLREAGAWENKS